MTYSELKQLLPLLVEQCAKHGGVLTVRHDGSCALDFTKSTTPPPGNPNTKAKVRSHPVYAQRDHIDPSPHSVVHAGDSSFLLENTSQLRCGSGYPKQKRGGKKVRERRERAIERRNSKTQSSSSSGSDTRVWRPVSVVSKHTSEPEIPRAETKKVVNLYAPEPPQPDTVIVPPFYSSDESEQSSELGYSVRPRQTWGRPATSAEIAASKRPTIKEMGDAIVRGDSEFIDKHLFSYKLMDEPIRMHLNALSKRRDWFNDTMRFGSLLCGAASAAVAVYNCIQGKPVKTKGEMLLESFVKGAPWLFMKVMGV